MTTPSTRAGDTSLTRDLLSAARYYLLGPRGIVIMAVIAIVAGVAFNWSWLVAAGIAPILLAALPCAIMCGLGLCTRKLVGTSCAQEQSRPTVQAKPIETLSAQLDLFEPSSPAQVHERTEAPEAVSHETQTQPADERRHSHA